MTDSFVGYGKNALDLADPRADPGCAFYARAVHTLWQRDDVDLGVSPYRKYSNVLAEVFGRYAVSDYRGILGEYERARAERTAPLKTLPLDT